jgi:CRISPR-associated protein Csb2
MLTLDIEWLMGICFAARSPAETGPDWPPQADRVFSALTASWGARGERREERAALEWLEAQPAPAISAAALAARTTVTTYVPPNDAAVGDIRILPERRRRQPRQFPAATLHAEPGQTHLRLTWPTKPPADCLAALRTLARDTSYIGHSSSVVRCAFHAEAGDIPAHLRPVPAVAAPYRGRLNELKALHDRHRAAADSAARPRRIQPVPVRATDASPASVFGRNWLVLEYAGGDRPDLRAAVPIGRTMRDAMMSVWGPDIPTWLSGHEADSTPARTPHMAVVPLANAGFAWSDGGWHGLGLVLPAAETPNWLGMDSPRAFANRQRLLGVFRALADGHGDGRLIRLRLGQLGCVRLRLVDAPERHETQSLRPGRYFRPSRRWSTVTPIALDRHPKGPDARAAAAGIIAQACERIGLPRPAHVAVFKHPAMTGVPSAWPPGGAPRWTGWARPGALAGRPLTHATVTFAAPVHGPVILGAGRFFGLGLCLPLEGGAEP